VFGVNVQNKWIQPNLLVLCNSNCLYHAFFSFSQRKAEEFIVRLVDVLLL
jgi:hypothetical protein